MSGIAFFMQPHASFRANGMYERPYQITAHIWIKTNARQTPGCGLKYYRVII